MSKIKETTMTWGNQDTLKVFINGKEVDATVLEIKTWFEATNELDYKLGDIIYPKYSHHTEVKISTRD